MTKVCKECGEELSFSSGPDGSLVSTCENCGYAERVPVTIEDKEDVFDDEEPEAGLENVGEGGHSEDPGDESDTMSKATKGCRSCGGTLAYSEDENGDVVGSCAGCGGSFRFAFVRPGRSRPERVGGGRFEGRRSGGWRGERGSSGGGQSRGCRQCGAPLAFTTNDDGTVTGSCTACGNRFTLPPRRGGQGGGGGFQSRGDRRGGGRGFGSGFGSSQGGRGGGGRFGGRGGGNFRGQGGRPPFKRRRRDASY